MPVLNPRRAAAVAVVVSLILMPEASGAPGSGVVTVAHRGASVSAPENTLSAVAEALASRTDFIETDVRLTADGVPILMHDPSLARTTNVESVFPDRAPWRVEQFTLAEVQRLDAGSWKSPSYADERVPTLAAALQQLAQSPNGAIVEVKDPSTYGGVDDIGAKVYDAVREYWPDALTTTGPRRLLVSSADEAFAQQFAERYPDVDVAVVSLTPPSDATKAFVDDVEVRWDATSPELAAEGDAAGFSVGAWTVNDSETMKQLSDHVDSITTDDPMRLRRTLESQDRVYAGTNWPAKESARPSWTLGTSGRYLNTRVGVRGLLTTAAGTPARWQRAAVQRRVDGGWRTVLRRATDAEGRFSASLQGTRRLRIRIVSLDDWQYPVAASAAKDVALSKIGTSIRLTGPRSVRRVDGATLEIRWRTSDNRAVSGRSRLFRYRDGAWRYLRDVAVSDGYGRTRVRPGRTARYEIRGVGGWWYAGDVDDKRIEVRG